MAWWRRNGGGGGEAPRDSPDDRMIVTVGRDRFEVDLMVQRLRVEGIAATHGPRDGSRPYLDDNSIHVRRADLANARALLGIDDSLAT